MGEVVLEVLAAYPPVLDWRDAAGLVLLCAARDATDPSRDAVVEPLPDGGWPTAQFPLEWGLFLGEDSAALGLVVTAPRSHELDLLNQKDGPTSQPRHVYALRASGARLNAPPAPGARFRVRVGASKPQAATFWLAAFERAQLNVFEALPDTVLARRESEVLLVGDFWSYAAEASGVRVLLELEDGRSIELSAKLDGVLGGVTFLTPAVEEAQMCTVTALFDFHETAFRSNSVGLEFRGLPNLKCRTKFIPKSVGGTITLTGGLFKERDALNAFLTSPPIDETGKFEHLKTAAERCALAVRLCGGSAASAAAAAVAAALAEQLVEESVGAITIVSDAVRSTGGTQAVGNAATDAMFAAPVCGPPPRASKARRPSADLMVSSGAAFFSVPTKYVDGVTLTLQAPRDLPGKSVRVAFTRDWWVPVPLEKRPNHLVKAWKEPDPAIASAELFTVGGVWPVCGDAHGGTVLRISGINFDAALIAAGPLAVNISAAAAFATHYSSAVGDAVGAMRCALSSVPRTSSFRHAPGALKKKTALNDDKRESAMFAGGTLQRSASLKFGSGEARSKAQSGEMRVSVLFKLISPTTNRVLHKTIVDGLLLRLTPMQASATCSAGAKTFGDLAACSKHEIAATCRLAQAVVSRLGGECVVQCKTPACPLSLLAHGNSFAATVEVSLSGPDGPFTSDGATFEYIRNPTLKAVSPLGEALVPGRTQVLLKGTGLSKSSFLNLALYGAPEGPTSQPLEFSVSNMDEFEGSASLDHVDLGPRRSFERFSFDRDRPASRPTSSLLPLAPDAFLKAKLPFVVRRRYFSKMPKQLHLFAGAYRRYSLWAHAAPAHVELHESPNTSFREEAATRRERRPSAGSLGRAIDKLAPKRPDYANAMSRPLPRMNSSTTSKGLKSDSYLGGAMPSQQLPALGGRRSSHRGTLPTAPGAKSAAARFAVKKLGLKMERNGDRRTTNVDADYVVNEIGFETSANGQDWDSPGSRTLKLNPPYALSRMEPALGPCRGGTPIVIFGAHFTPNQKCFIAFLCAGASNRTAAHEASRRKSFVSHSDKFVKHLVDSIMPKNAGHDAADTAVFSKVIMKRLYSSAVRIQAMARGMIYRRHSKGGIPCAVVEGLATSSTTITCLSPKVLAPGRVDVAVSFDGENFEYVPTEKLRQVRLEHLLCDLGVEAEDAVAAAAALSNGAEDDDNIVSAEPAAAQNFDGLRALGQCDANVWAALYECRAHLQYKFYAAPVLIAVTHKDGPFTDSLQLQGRNFFARGKSVVVRFQQTIEDDEKSLEPAFFAPAVVSDAQNIAVSAPPGLLSGSTVAVAVSLNFGVDFTEEFVAFLVKKKPVLQHMRPNCGPRAGGTAIRITGLNFGDEAPFDQAVPPNVKVRFSLAADPAERSSTRDVASGRKKLCTVSAIYESPFAVCCRLPPMGTLLPKASEAGPASPKAWVQSMSRRAQRLWFDDGEGQGSTNVNSVVSLFVDVCIVGGAHFFGEALVFQLYDHIPKLQNLKPRGGSVAGGYSVKCSGSGFLQTDSITARLIPLPYSAPATRPASEADSVANDGSLFGGGSALSEELSGSLPSSPFQGSALQGSALQESVLSEVTSFGGALSPLASVDTVEEHVIAAVHPAINEHVIAAVHPANVGETVKSKRQTSFGNAAVHPANVGDLVAAEHRQTLFGKARIGFRQTSIGARATSSVGTSVCDSEGQMNVVEVVCTYRSENEVDFEMPSLQTLGDFGPGVYLVQVSLNSAEWSQPHESSCFEIFENVRGGAHRRGAALLPQLLVVRGPADSNSSKAAHRLLKNLLQAGKRHLAHNDTAATNNARARKELVHAETVAHLSRPSLGAVARVAAHQVDEHGSLAIDEAELLHLARLSEAPKPFLALDLPSFEGHPLLRHRRDLDLVGKLRLLHKHGSAWRAFFGLFHDAFLVVQQADRRDAGGLTYGELCELLLLKPRPASIPSRLFPSSTQMDLLKAWAAVDPFEAVSGVVTVDEFLRHLILNERPPSPTPSSTRYTPLKQSAYNPRGPLGV